MSFGKAGFELVKEIANSKTMASKTLQLYEDIIKNSK